MKKSIKAAAIAVAVMALPLVTMAQNSGGVAGEIQSLQKVLDKLYDELLPMCSKLIGIGRAIAGFAATWYIAARVWKHIAHAEPVDFYGLLRPFALNLAILFFPLVMSIMNGIMKPTVSGTASLVSSSNETVKKLFEQKEKEMRESDQWKALVGPSEEGNKALWLAMAHPNETEEGWLDGLGNDIEFMMDKMAYNFKNEIRRVISVVLEIIYAAAALCVNTLRTFNLIILAILGPLVFGISVFDGFQHALTTYLARFINVYLWLPVANILSMVLSKIQENMLKMDLSQITHGGQTFFNTYDLGYMIFMLIGIIAYTTVPSLCDQIIHVGGGGALQSRVTSIGVGGPMRVFNSAVSTSMGAGAMAGGMSGDGFGNNNSTMTGGQAGANGSGNYFKDKVSGAG